MSFDKNTIEKVGKQLTIKLAQALKQGEIKEEELHKVSSFILNNIDNIKSQEELISFLTKLSDQWPVFKDSLTLEKAEKKQEQEKQTTDQVSQLIKENKIDEAIETTKNNLDN